MKKKYPTSFTALFLNYGFSLLFILIAIVFASLYLFEEVTVVNGLLSVVTGVSGLVFKYILVRENPIAVWFDPKGEIIFYLIVSAISFIAIIADLIPFLA